MKSVWRSPTDMRTARLIALALIGAATVVPLGAQEPAKAPSLRTEVQGFVRSFVKAANEADTATLVELYARVPEVASIGDGEITRGWEAIRADADSLLGSQGSYRIDLGSIDVVPLGAEHALAFAPTSITVAAEKGTVKIRGAMTFVLHRTGDGWKIIHDHSSVVGSPQNGD